MKMIENNTLDNNHSVKPENLFKVMVIDDDRTTRLMLQSQIEELGHEVSVAEDGKQGLSFIKQENNKIDVILLDREMPEMDGLEVVMRMKEDAELRNIPVIMQTGSDQPEQIKQGIDSGVFYYLTKPVDEEILRSVLSAAMREVGQQKVLNAELDQHKTSFNLINTCKFQYTNLIEAESLACFIANCYPDPQRVVSGLAELLINAVEHGNLAIGYNEKTQLVNNGKWRDELIYRSNLPEHKEKYVEVTLKNNQDQVSVTILDQGKGFDWRKYIYLDPARAQDNHGRGIAQANIVSFDQINYNAIGNEVTAFVNKEADIDW